ncbi:alanine racemase [Enterococcus timonensis]|uniref:alanine racemase n=1 Tax=Enterococcus timonensis TaxID=1852364 RepID=UPI0008DAF092|nr:alanine racemase [Enterococcus timonensis]
MITGWHRPTRIIVDPQKITENILSQRKIIAPDKEIFAVVKANGYGHGDLAVAKAALKAGVTGFCVALLDEALHLRENGITEPILILNMVDPQFLSLASENNLSVTCGNQEWLDQVLAQINHLSIQKPLKLHLKIDSGMGRIGFFDEKSLQKAAQIISDHPQLELEGIFTHFATADEADEEYYQHQLSTFKKLLDTLPQLPRYVHSSNSAAALWHEAGVGNMIRMGISMYGLNPSGSALVLPVNLQPALELVSELIQVKLVPADTGISYGKTYTTDCPQWIGTVPIGYADGYLRSLQGFHVLVEGELCEIVGRINMDQLMIHLPKKFPLGTKVTLIGENRGKIVSAQDVADFAKTIHYEICCLLSDRLPRIYLGERDQK